MEEYTKDDILKALLDMNLKTRTRVLVDQRSYLIGVLAYKFMMTEHGISKITGIKRDTVNYNKKLVLQFCKDKLYVQNVYVYAQLYPFDFNMVNSVRLNRLKRVELDLDQKFFNKLKATGSILGHDDIRITIKFLLEKSMKLWEE